MILLSRPKLVIVMLIVILFLATAFIASKKLKPAQELQPSPKTSATDQPQIVSTKPDPLDETIIPASEPIEITFNRSLQNVPEFKIRFEPKPDYKVELSSDRKTAKIIFIKPLELGTSFTLYIQPDTKFDGVGDWKQDKIYQFRTVKYTGV